MKKKWLLSCFFIVMGISAFSQAPANDDCSNLVSLTVNSGETCTTHTAGTNVNATASLSQGFCTIEIADDDVWYLFMATASAHLITVKSTAANGIVSPEIILINGGSCGTLTPNMCANYNTDSAGLFAYNLTPGSYYYITVHSIGNNNADQGNFNICVTTPPVPANNECNAAIALTVNTGPACVTQTAATSRFATYSQSGCNGDADDDVWFTFTATDATHFVAVKSTAANGIVDPELEVFSGSCGALSSIVCTTISADSVSALLSGLTIGDTYTVRVYSYDDGLGFQGGFNICVTSPLFVIPPPANNECSNAVDLTVNPGLSCITQTQGTTLNATQSQTGCNGTADDDVWYKFTATGSGHIITVKSAATNGIVEPELQIFSGTCGTLVSIDCINGAIDSTGILLTGLTAGNIYYARVYSHNAAAADQGAFDICVTTIPIPVNDSCEDAIMLNVQAGSSCTTPTLGTTKYASETMPACDGNADDDVWYTFTATATSHLVNVEGIGTNGIVFPRIEIFSGTCGSLTSINCSPLNIYNSSNNKIVASGLTIANTYYVRVYSSNLNTADQGDFEICVLAAQQPANDSCQNAVSLTVNSGIACTVQTSGTTKFATAGGLGCYSLHDDDVWYKFIATAAGHQVTVKSSATNGIVYPQIEIFSGTCSTLSSLKCNYSAPDSVGMIVPGLTTGNTYYVRVSSLAVSFYDQGEFTICITTPPIPANDSCAGAINLTVNAGTDCIVQSSGNTTYASDGSAGCYGFPDDDVWYKFTATATGHLVSVKSSAVNGLAFPGIETYSGTCGTLTPLACDYYIADSSRVFLNGLTVGDTYFIRVSSLGSVLLNRGSFSICVTTMPANNECATAINIPVNSNNTCTQQLTGTTKHTTESMPGCVGTANDDVWYSFTASSTSHIISVTSTATGGIVEPVVQLFSGACGSLTSVLCNTFTTATSNEFFIDTFTIGVTYYVRVYSHSALASNSGAFTICVKSPPIPANNECAGAINVPVNLDQSCTQQVTATSKYATQSMPGCVGAADDDVWFSFTAASVKQIISVTSTATDGILQPVIQVFSGNCAGLTSVNCQNFTSNTFAETAPTSFVAGNVYYIRVYSNATGVTNAGGFTICIKAASINDNCIDAITLSVNPDNTCTQQFTGTKRFATTGGPTDCGGGTSSTFDVWYKFTATATTHEVVVNSLVPGGMDNPYIQVFTGTCNSLTSINCYINPLPGTTYLSASVLVSNITVGTVYYVRVYNSFYQSTDGGFTICVKTPPILANDECSGAINLPVNNDGTCTLKTTGTTLGAFQSAPGCNGAAAYDVWYVFTATSSAHSIVVSSTVTGGIQNQSIQLYNGGCNSLIHLLCENYSSSLSYLEVVISGISVGGVYRVRVYSPSVSNNGSFTICVKTFTPPVNDLCSGAINVPVNAADTCAQVLTGTTKYATSGISGLSYSDVWYKFTATDTRHIIYVRSSGAPALLSPTIYCYSGNCNNLVLTGADLGNNDFSAELPLSGLIIGNEYYVRITNFHPSVSFQGSFTICVRTPAFIEPPNDECSGAIDVPINTGYDCVQTITGTTRFASLSPNFPGGGGGSPSDVWYKFIATATVHAISVKSVQSLEGAFKPNFYLVTGDCATQSYTSLGDANQGFHPSYYASRRYSGLTIGQTYFIRVFTFVTGGFNGETYKNWGNFSLCISTPPANECSNAETLTFGLKPNEHNYAYNTNGASQSQPACNGTNAAFDVWYKFTAIDKPVAIAIDRVNFLSIQAELFSGSCGSLTSMLCQNTDNIIMPTGLTPGQEYYLRFFVRNGSTSQSLQFSITAYQLPRSDSNTLFPSSCLLPPISQNTGFESYNFCSGPVTNFNPIGAGIINGWSPPTSGTPDYLNSCSEMTEYFVATNECFGKQFPRTGKGMTGIFVYIANGYREYIQGQLSGPMVPGKTYLVSYWVNLANISDLAIDRLGVYFATAATNVSTSKNLDVTPQLVSPLHVYFTDKENWANIAFQFIPTQAYTHFIIGNFANNENTNTQAATHNFLKSPNLLSCAIPVSTSYMYIDDVTIAEIITNPNGSLCNNVPLPLRLLSFTGTVVNTNDGFLQWKTSNEQGTSHFEVEGSMDGIQFVKIGTVNAANRPGENHYNFTDPGISGVRYYRIKMMDRDGKFTYSNIVKLSVGGRGLPFSIYPNPANEVITISGLDAGGTIQLYSLDGKLLQTQNTTAQAETLDISRLPAATYFIVFRKGSKVQRTQFIKQ